METIYSSVYLNKASKRDLSLIRLQALEACVNEPLSITVLIHKININYNLVRDIIQPLIENGLIQILMSPPPKNIRSFYSTTKKGREILNASKTGLLKGIFN